MHDLSCETAFTKYTLRGIPYDPITMTVLTLAGGAMSAAGTLAAGSAAARSGKAQQQAMNFRAQQEQQAAQESRAVGQRGAMESRRQGDLALSTLQARAAAGGGNAADPTVLNLGGNIAGRSEYDALFNMYRGENKARGLEDTAMGDRMTGDALSAEGAAKQNASYLSAGGTIIGSIGSAYKNYLPGAPPPGSGEIGSRPVPPPGYG